MTQIPLVPVLLDSLVTRVEEGDALTKEELELIGREVERRPDSLDWRLCLAHALINSDQPHRALEVLKFEGADTMREILLHMARARAFGALERYAEAEVELKKILQIYPGHADALRSLAILRLRAGAPADAAALCESVLLADPLDEPTRQILAEAREAMDEAAAGKGGVTTADPDTSAPEAQAASSPAAQVKSPRLEKLSKAAFYKKLSEALKETGWQHRLIQDKERGTEDLVVSLPHRGPVRLPVTDFWAEGRGTNERREAVIAELLRQLHRIDDETPLA